MEIRDELLVLVTSKMLALLPASPEIGRRRLVSLPNTIQSLLVVTYLRFVDDLERNFLLS